MYTLAIMGPQKRINHVAKLGRITRQRIHPNLYVLGYNLRVVGDQFETMKPTGEPPTEYTQLVAAWQQLPLWLQLCADDFSIIGVANDAEWETIGGPENAEGIACPQYAGIRYLANEKRATAVLAEEVLHMLDARLGDRSVPPTRYCYGDAWQGAMKSDGLNMRIFPQLHHHYNTLESTWRKGNHMLDRFERSQFLKALKPGEDARHAADKDDAMFTEAALEALPDVFHIQAMHRESATFNAFEADEEIGGLIPSLYPLYLGPKPGHFLHRDVWGGIHEVNHDQRHTYDPSELTPVLSFREACEHYFAEKKGLSRQAVKFDLSVKGYDRSVSERTLKALAKRERPAPPLPFS